MIKIDTSNWKSFRIGDLFDIHPTKHYKKTNAELFSEDGTAPVIVNSAYNNGVGGYANLEPTEKGNIITFSDTTNSDSIFYQENDFIGYPHVQGVYPFSKKWSKNSLRFFVVMFRKAAELKGFNYVNKFTRELAKEMKIKLPTHNILCLDIDKIQDIVEMGGDVDMTRIDTSSWKEFKLSDLFEKIDLKFKKDTFNKGNDISTVQTEEFSLPLCNAKDGNNGVMYYGRLSDFEYAEKVLDIVSDGAISTGNVYVQIDKVGVLYNAYLIKPKIEIPDKALFFISTVLQKVLKEKYNYDNKAGWNKVKDEVISLPIKEVEEIDFEYMEQYIEGIENNINNTLRVLKTTQNGAKSLINTSEWKDFKLSEIFTKAERGNIKSLQTLSEGNTPIVAAGGYNQGIAGFYNVEPKYENCITISCNGAGCGSTFYHNYPFNLNGDAIVLIDNGLSEYVKMYLASVINKLLTSKYSYEEKCSADKALNESIKLPTNNQGKIDFQILEDSLKAVMKRERERLLRFQAIL